MVTSSASVAARPLTSADYRIGISGIFVAALLAMAAHHQAITSWNVNSRMALVFAVVDRGTFAIDGYVGDDELLPTGDKAEFGGHFYSDKAFGVSVLCIPVYAAMQGIARLLGFEWGLQSKIYVLRMVSASIPAAIALSLLWLVLIRAGAMPRRALVVIVVAFFGSMWFGYSTLAMPYSPGIAASLAAIYLLCYPPPSGFGPTRAAAVGLFSGLALIFDFLFGPLVVVAIAAAFLVRLPRRRLDRLVQLVGYAIAAGALPLIAFAVYSYSIFGAVSVPYQYETLPLFREGMSHGIMGVTTPRLGPLWFLTFHPYRGIFFWSPWILIALAGSAMAVRDHGLRRTLGWMGMWSFAAALYLTSSYYMWWGGFSMGPRLMLPMMATVPFGLIEVCRRDRSRLWWLAFVATGAISIALSLPLSLIDPQMPQIEDTADLLVVSPAKPLRVPQFDYLRQFYSGDWFSGAQSDQALRLLPLVALPLVAAIFVQTARRLPRDTSPD